MTHISRSLLRGSLDLDSTLPPLLHLQTHRRRFFPSTYVRQFSNRGWSCKPRAAASDTPSLSTPRDLRQHRDAQTAVHCISALVPTCPVAAGSPLAVAAPGLVWAQPPDCKIRHRFENHLISTSCYTGRLSKFHGEAQGFCITGSLRYPL